MTVADIIIFNDISMFMALTGKKVSEMAQCPNIAWWYTNKMLANTKL